MGQVAKGEIVGLTANTQYHIKVTGTKGSSTTESTDVSQWTLPAQPTDLTQTSRTHNEIVVSWTQVSGADYMLRFKKSGVTDWTDLGNLGKVATRIITGLDTET